MFEHYKEGRTFRVLMEQTTDHFAPETAALQQRLISEEYEEFLEAHAEASHYIQNKRSREACMANPSLYNYTVDITQSHSIQWITSVQNDENPFFLYMSFTVPHAGKFFSS